jgi:hypothetical protein
MTLLPGTNYMSDSARTEAEMKVALDKVNEVIAEIGSKEVFVSTLATGVLATPLSSMVSVASEGGASTPDTLLSIGVSNITQGRIVILKNENASSTATAGAYITITHGTGAEAVEMLDGENFILCSRRQLALIYTDNHWVEVWRTYGRNTVAEKLAERDDIGLGNASVENIATSSVGGANSKVLKVAESANIPTNGLLAIDASGNIITGSVTGGNADTLDNLDSLRFVRSDAGAAQTIDNSLTLTSSGDTTLVINDTSGANSPAVAFNHGANERASIFYNSADGSSEWITKDSAGTTTESVRLDPATNKFEFAVDGATWQSLTPGAGNGLNADQLDGTELVDMWLHVAPQLKKIVFLTSHHLDIGGSSSSTPELIPQLTNIAYPTSPNGSRRFLITAHLFLQTGGTDSGGNERVNGMYVYSGDGANVGQIFGSQSNTGSSSWDTGNVYYEYGFYEKIHTPAAGDLVSVGVREYNSLHRGDVLADSGEGALSNRITNASPNSYYSNRTFVLIEYLDEG